MSRQRAPPSILCRISPAAARHSVSISGAHGRQTPGSAGQAAPLPNSARSRGEKASSSAGNSRSCTAAPACRAALCRLRTVSRAASKICAPPAGLSQLSATVTSAPPARSCVRISSSTPFRSVKPSRYSCRPAANVPGSSAAASRVRRLDGSCPALAQAAS